MPQNLRGRSFLQLLDFSPEEVKHLVQLAVSLKLARKGGYEMPLLVGRNIALIFENDCIRTQSGFELAAYDQGAHVTHLGSPRPHVARNEPVKDTARFLGRLYDGIALCGFAHAQAEALSEHAGVPVYNGLTNVCHPTQTLADLMTMRELTRKYLSDISVCFMGDVGNSVAVSLLEGATLVGMDVRLCGPRSCWPDPVLIARCRTLAECTGARITLTEDPGQAVDGSDFVYTNAWLSADTPVAAWEQRLALLSPYRVTSAVMEATGNPRTRLLHSLPAFHNRDTELGDAIFAKFGMDGLEVTEEVFESRASAVFDQAENRMHTIKAVMVSTIGP